MLIIWSGFGFLPVTFFIASALCFDSRTDAGLAYACFVTGLASGALGWYLNSRPARIMIDKKTGREFALRRRHSLFFIPMMYWGPIFIVLGLYFLFFSPVKH